MNKRYWNLDLKEWQYVYLLEYYMKGYRYYTVQENGEEFVWRNKPVDWHPKQKGFMYRLMRFVNSSRLNIRLKLAKHMDEPLSIGLVLNVAELKHNVEVRNGD